MTGQRSSPSKRAKASTNVASNELDSDIDHLQPAPKKASTTKLASKWRWNEQRRQTAINKAVAVNLFSYSVEDGSRDAKCKEIVSELNKNTEEDINWVLLTFEAYRKKVYEIQRKVLKLKDNDDALDLLPEAEKQLFEQLKEIGQVQEAGIAKLAGDTSSVIL